MNKQSNTYTILYASIMVIVVAAVLGYTALTLRPLQQKNVEIDKKSQILSAVRIASTPADAEELYKKYIVADMIVNQLGEVVSQKDGFAVNIQEETALDATKRQLPVFVCKIDSVTRYILPMYGAGLWGPIWGYVSVDSDGSTLYGATFAHQGETPGLGAEISKPQFSDQFMGKHLFVDNEFKSVAVLKKGLKAPNGEEQVDAISGGTITSKGVNDMLFSWLSPYRNFLKQLK